MPPKPKLHKNKGKFSIPPPKLPQNLNDPSTSEVPSIEVQQKFETELCWCIQQLQTALKSGKLNNKQIQDHTKALNILMSNVAPMVRKRQVMRLSFGDYRDKMAVEDKKSCKNAVNMKVKPAAPETSKKSVFVKKSTFTSNSGSTFRFNFESPNNGDDISNSFSTVKIESEDSCEDEIKNKNNAHKFVPSDNSFRFKFDLSDT